MEKMMKQIKSVFNDILYHLRFAPGRVRQAFFLDIITLLETEGFIKPGLFDNPAHLGPVGKTLLHVYEEVSFPLKSEGVEAEGRRSNIEPTPYREVFEDMDIPDMSPSALDRDKKKDD
jgi:hypothetical protein